MRILNLQSFIDIFVEVYAEIHKELQEIYSLKFENQLCFSLYSASREVVKKYHPYLTEIGLTYAQYITMMVMWEEKKLSVKELGEKLF